MHHSTKDLIERIARVCYEANRAYCVGLGDASFGPWDEAPEWQKETIRNGIRFHFENPLANPIDSHQNWMREKVATGWIYGPEKDPVLKTHPCMVPYHELPEEQRRKDSLFIAIVRALEPRELAARKSVAAEVSEKVNQIADEVLREG